MAHDGLRECMSRYEVLFQFFRPAQLFSVYVALTNIPGEREERERARLPLPFVPVRTFSLLGEKREGVVFSRPLGALRAA